MKLLLDTHALLWFIAGSASLSAYARTLIKDAANAKFVSIASIWETAIKVSLGKMPLTALTRMAYLAYGERCKTNALLQDS